MTMRKRTFMTVVMTLLCLMAWADNNQTVVVGGTAVEKYASQLTFDGNNVTITFEDGTAQTADMASVSISLSYDDASSGITQIIPAEENVSRVYSVSGQYMGNSVEAMPKGLYIVNGKKVVIR